MELNVFSDYIDDYFHWPGMPFLAPTLDNADPLFALVIIQGFHLYRSEVPDIKTQVVAVYK